MKIERTRSLFQRRLLCRRRPRILRSLFSYIVRGNQINALNLKYSDNNPMLNYPLLGVCLLKYETDFSTVNYDPFN